MYGVRIHVRVFSNDGQSIHIVGFGAPSTLSYKNPKASFKLAHKHHYLYTIYSWEMIQAIPPFIGYCFTPIRIKVYEGLGPTSHLYKTHAIFKNHQYVHWFKSLKIFNLSIQNANKYEFLQFFDEEERCWDRELCFGSGIFGHFYLFPVKCISCVHCLGLILCIYVHGG